MHGAALAHGLRRPHTVTSVLSLSKTQVLLAKWPVYDYAVLKPHPMLATHRKRQCAVAHPEVGDEAGGVAVAHDDLVDVHRRDVQPRPRQQIARVPHLGQTNTMVALE